MCKQDYFLQYYSHLETSKSRMVFVSTTYYNYHPPPGTFHNWLSSQRCQLLEWKNFSSTAIYTHVCQFDPYLWSIQNWLGYEMMYSLKTKGFPKMSQLMPLEDQDDRACLMLLLLLLLLLVWCHDCWYHFHHILVGILWTSFPLVDYLDTFLVHF